MKIFFSHSAKKLTIEGMEYEAKAACPLLTVRDKTRSPRNMARTTPGDEPYDPMRFPVGTWVVFDVRPREDSYRAPFFIATTAKQRVEVWSVKDSGGETVYDKPSGRFVVDEGYGIHYSLSPTTQGCIKVYDRALLEELAALVQAAIKNRELVTLIVTE